MYVAINKNYYNVYLFYLLNKLNNALSEKKQCFIQTN